jgi:hypothetical protein
MLGRACHHALFFLAIFLATACDCDQRRLPHDLLPPCLSSLPALLPTCRPLSRRRPRHTATRHQSNRRPLQPPLCPAAVGPHQQPQTLASPPPPPGETAAARPTSASATTVSPPSDSSARPPPIELPPDLLYAWRRSAPTNNPKP